MKCVIREKKNMTIMTVAGLVLIAIGVVGFAVLPEEAHLLSRVAGFLAGLGTSLAVMGAGVLIWRAAVGERRAAESDMAMQDERGQAIAYRAQSMLAVAAVCSLIVIIIVALLRGDRVYLMLGAGLCMICTVVKFVALRVYGKRM